MKTLTLRGIDPALADALREYAKNKEQSINQTAVKLLKDALGVTSTPTFKEYHDLDHLAGTWTEDDEKEFLEATADFRKIDTELWK